MDGLAEAVHSPATHDRGLADKVSALEEELAQLRREFDDFRRRFE